MGKYLGNSWAGIALFCVWVFSLSAHAQSHLMFYSPATGPQIVYAQDMMAMKNAGAHARVNLVGGTFNVVFLDVENDTNIGFDDPTKGAERRAALTAVFDYIASKIDEPGHADINVAESFSTNNGVLALAGPLYDPVGPDGFLNGFVFDHLSTNFDPYGAYPDGQVQVNFYYPWHTNLSSSPPFGSYDLFTVLLHEVTHSLGFLSFASSTGASRIGYSSAGHGRFSVLDSHLKRGSSGKQLYLSGGTINAVSADFISQDLYFAGPRATAELGVNPKIYAPSPYEGGSSISHVDLNSYEEVAVMVPQLADGVAKRQYADWEIQMLGDIGYHVIACGDGAVAGDEDCDDGNSVNTDACDNNCHVSELCGNNELDLGEQCDDGNTVNSDACTAACQSAFCGDNIVRDAEEECDDGNDNDNDACRNNCQLAGCGDSVIQVGTEQCDDGNDDNEDLCSNSCVNLGCGNGDTQVGVEECDDGNEINTDACTATCELAACGDNHPHVGVEACDDGNGIDTDICTNECTLARCGDGIVRHNIEDCDDGNTENNDSCTNACLESVCGDGFVDADTEACDDGNIVGGDTCAANCRYGILPEPSSGCSAFESAEPRGTWIFLVILTGFAGILVTRRRRQSAR